MLKSGCKCQQPCEFTISDNPNTGWQDYSDLGYACYRGSSTMIGQAHLNGVRGRIVLFGQEQIAERKREKNSRVHVRAHTHTVKERPCIHWYALQMTTMSRAGPARSLNPHLCLQCRW